MSDTNDTTPTYPVPRLPSPDPFGPLWEVLYGLTREAWPEVYQAGGGLFRGSAISRMNLLEMLQKGTLHPPFCVIEMPPPTPAGGWGAAFYSHDCRPAFWYVMDISRCEYPEEALSPRLFALDEAHQRAPFLTRTGDASYDTNENNTLNTLFTAGQFPLYAACVRLNFQYGYMIGNFEEGVAPEGSASPPPGRMGGSLG